VIDLTPLGQYQRAYRRDSNLPTMAVAGELHVNRGEPNHGWKIIGLMHNGDCRFAFPVSGERADWVRGALTNRIQAGQKKSTRTRPGVQSAVNQNLD
jgi:hypothetical protein